MSCVTTPASQDCATHCKTGKKVTIVWYFSPFDMLRLTFPPKGKFITPPPKQFETRGGGYRGGCTGHGVVALPRTVAAAREGGGGGWMRSIRTQQLGRSHSDGDSKANSTWDRGYFSRSMFLYSKRQHTTHAAVQKRSASATPD